MSTYLLAGEEDEDIALRLTQVDLHDGADGRLEVVSLRLWRVEDLDRVEAAGHLHERRGVEVGLELSCVQRRRHHHQLQIRPLRRHLLDEAKEDVSRESALVRLVKDDGGVALEHGVVHCLAQQHAVCHVLELRLRPRHVLEADRVPDLLSQLHIHLL